MAPQRSSRRDRASIGLQPSKRQRPNQPCGLSAVLVTIANGGKSSEVRRQSLDRPSRSPLKRTIGGLSGSQAAVEVTSGLDCDCVRRLHRHL
jgi:hypothetical protein